MQDLQRSVCTEWGPAAIPKYDYALEADGIAEVETFIRFHPAIRPMLQPGKILR